MGCGISKADPEDRNPIKVTVDDNLDLDDEQSVVCLKVDDAGSSPARTAGILPHYDFETGCRDVIINDGLVATEAPGNALRSNFLEVRTILQHLSAVNSNPIVGLSEAAELLCRHLGVALLSIIACREGVPSYVLVAAYGTGASDLEKISVMQGTCWSPFMLDSNANHLHISLKAEEQTQELPKDWALLHQHHGLRSFLAVPIGSAGQVQGLLTIAKREPCAFDDEWWEPMLSVLAVGLLPQLRDDVVGGLYQFVRVLHGTQDHLALVALLLQGAQQFMLQTTNINMGVRLGLVNNNRSKALIFEVDSKAVKGGEEGKVRDAMPDVTITSLGLDNTLLLDAILKGKARFVSDCATYLQSCVKPATDIFISSQCIAASIVVLPVAYDDQTLGGLYFTLETPCNFQNLKYMLMGFVKCIVLVLVQKLEGQLHLFWDSVVQRHLSLASNASGPTKDALEPASSPQSITGQPQETSLARSLTATEAEGPAEDLQLQNQRTAGVSKHQSSLDQAENLSTSPAAGGDGTSCRQRTSPAGLDSPAGARAQVAVADSPAGSVIAGQSPAGQPVVTGTSDAADGPRRPLVKRTCTQAMLMVLQSEIRNLRERKQQLAWLADLVLLETIGKGGFGVVYKGSWQGSLAAVKVMYARQHERQAMKDALEMAVLTSVSHPNIIQVYNCFTNMVEDAGTLSAQPEGGISVRFRRLEPGEDNSDAMCNIMLMEYCDQGSLWHALKRGVFHRRLGKNSLAVDLCAIVKVLMEVAASVQHLHSLQLLHCDIKPENILLKTDNSTSLGFTAKLSDFGLAKLLRDNKYIINRSGSGTVSHLAPELFLAGSKVTTAVDTFSFGITMWELYMGQRAYNGLSREAIVDKVYKQRSRPVFPAGVPSLYSDLAQLCWDNDQQQRPSFTVIRQKLREMLTAFSTGSWANPDSLCRSAPEDLGAVLLAVQANQQLQQMQLQFAAQQSLIHEQQERLHAEAVKLLHQQDSEVASSGKQQGQAKMADREQLLLLQRLTAQHKNSNSA